MRLDPELGFSLPDGLPNGEYTISDGTISVVLAREGGISAVEYHGPRRTDDARRGAYYANGIWRREPLFDAPVIELAASIGPDAPRPIPFRDLVLCPFGVSTTFRLGGAPCEAAVWIRTPAIFLELVPAADARVGLIVREGFLGHRNEVSTWERSEFDAPFTGQRYDLRRNFAAGTPARESIRQRHEACSAVACLNAAVRRRDEDRTVLEASVAAGVTARFVIVFGEDTEEVADRLRTAAREGEEWLTGQVARYRAQREGTPRLSAASAAQGAVLAELVRAAPLFVESTRREKDPHEVGLRASTRGYGLWNGWDGGWGCTLLNACDSRDTVARYLNFLDSSRGPNNAIPMAMDFDFGPVRGVNFSHPPDDRAMGEGYHIMHEMWGLANLHQYYHRSGDTAALRARFPAFARSLRTICGHVSECGLVNSCFGGADRPEQLGRPVSPDPRDNNMLTSRLCGPEDHAALFTGCIQGAELAAVLGDGETVRRCADVARRVEKHFAGVFMNRGNGYLLDCVWPKGAPSGRSTLARITALLALAGYGEQLVPDDLDGIADCVMREFRHPVLGLRDIGGNPAVDVPAARRWADHWLQNATCETFKLARLTGRRDLMDVVMSAVLTHFDRNKIIHENLYAKPEVHPGRPRLHMEATSWWQSMTAWAWWGGVMESVAGVRRERGQVECVPGDAGFDVVVGNLRWAGRIWRVSAQGRGRWPAEIVVNGRLQRGSLQLVPAGDAVAQEAVVRKTDEAPRHPCILSAGAVPVDVVEASPARLRAILRSRGFARLHFYAPARPRLTAGGRTVDITWSERRSEGAASIEASGDVEVVLSC